MLFRPYLEIDEENDMDYTIFTLKIIIYCAVWWVYGSASIYEINGNLPVYSVVSAIA